MSPIALPDSLLLPCGRDLELPMTRRQSDSSPSRGGCPSAAGTGGEGSRVLGVGRGTRRRAAVNQRPAGSREGYVWLPARDFQHGPEPESLHARGRRIAVRPRRHDVPSLQLLREEFRYGRSNRSRVRNSVNHKKSACEPKDRRGLSPLTNERGCTIASNNRQEER